MNAHQENTNCRAFLIDASIYIFRAWFIYPDTIVDQQNRPINALYGFLYFLSDFITQVQPKHIAIAFDTSGKNNFRKTLYPPYKANRDPVPEELKYQFGLCHAVAQKLGINCLDSESFEADDLIASLADRYKQLDFGVTIVSADKDLAQLMNDEQDFLWDFARDEVYDAKRIKEKFGVLPDKIPDLLALAGDKVDNIPGASGVGIKTAAKLLQKFTDLEGILSNPDKLKQLKMRNSANICHSICNDVELIRLFYSLTNLTPQADIEHCDISEWLCPAAKDVDSILGSYEIDSILRSRFSRIAARNV